MLKPVLVLVGQDGGIASDGRRPVDLGRGVVLGKGKGNRDADVAAWVEYGGARDGIGDAVAEFHVAGADAVRKAAGGEVQAADMSRSVVQVGEGIEKTDSDFADDDQKAEFSGVKVVVDSASLQFLNGASLDYKEGLMGAGFTVNNPNTTRSCGCGQSFS